jgi:tripartite-type tricarboxylate transporter receptor subunit TctC
MVTAEDIMMRIRIVPLMALVALACSAAAQAPYPDKPVRIIVPYPAAGTSDILARVVAPHLQKKLGQPFIVDNRGGASGAIGTVAVAKAAADGHTLLLGTINTHGINSALQKNLAYDAVKDFAPITVIAYTPNVLSVHPSVPAKNLAELLALLRANPGKYSFGSTSIAGSPHMSGELLKAMAKVDIQHVPYKGAGPMLNDLIGGQIPMGFDNLPSSINFIKSGRIRAIALTTLKRWPGTPDIPTMAESGLPGYEVSGWFGLLAPASTPRSVVDLLHRTVAEIVKQPDVSRQLFDLGSEPGGNPPEAFARDIVADVEKWKKVAVETGAKAE